MSTIKAGGNFVSFPSLIGVTSGTSTPPPPFLPSYQFNDVGGSGGGDRNSFYIPTLYGT